MTFNDAGQDDERAIDVLDQILAHVTIAVGEPPVVEQGLSTTRRREAAILAYQASLIAA